MSLPALTPPLDQESMQRPHLAETVRPAPSRHRIRVGIDWSEDKQDWACIDDTDGHVLARGRFVETPAGFDDFDTQIRRLATLHNSGMLPSVCIETDKNLTVATLRQRGYEVYPVNPLAVARYRSTQAVSRGKSDKGDAALIANILRLDEHHRPMHNPTDTAIRLGVLARSHQDAVWRVDRLTSEVRSVLRLYYPAALGLLSTEETKQKKSDLARADLRAVLRHAPTPEAARRTRTSTWARVLREAGRKRGIDTLAKRLRGDFQQPALRQPPAREEAYGQSLLTLLTNLDAACQAQRDIEDQMLDVLHSHPIWPLLEPIHGMGEVTAARVLGELGDDLTRFDNVRSVRAYAGTAPVTRASGKSHVVNRRIVKNNRLANALYWWAFSAATSTPSGKAAYAHRIQCGDRQGAALRNIANRLVGCLWHCMTTGEMWDEQAVWRSFYRDDTDPSDEPKKGSDQDIEHDIDAGDDTVVTAQEVLAILLSDGDQKEDRER